MYTSKRDPYVCIQLVYLYRVLPCFVQDVLPLVQKA